jgi:hypothetical protein
MARKDGKPGRLAQIAQAYSTTRKTDRRLPWVLLGVWAIPVAIGVALGLTLGPIWMWVLLGITSGVLVAMIVFGRRAERAAFAQIEGQPGAAAASLNILRRGWTVTPAVAVTRNQDVVHRAVGRPGVVLVAEGSPTRVGNLLGQEKKKVNRVAPDVPVHELTVGKEPGQVPLRKLQRKVARLPNQLTSSQVSQLNQRLKALQSVQGSLPIPKGPLPKNVKLPKVPKE